MIVNVRYTKYEFNYPLRLDEKDYKLLRTDSKSFKRAFMKNELKTYIKRFLVWDIIMISSVLNLLIIINFFERVLFSNYGTDSFVFVIIFFIVYSYSGQLASNISLIKVMIQKRFFIKYLVKLAKSTESADEFCKLYLARTAYND
jgi:hypothetical protein